MNTLKSALIVIGILVVGFVILQFLPVGSISPALAFPGNPPAAQSIQWDSPQTEAVLRRACYDCHSNETVWPWYSRIAPVSWLVNKDVNEGRKELNLSNQRVGEEPDELLEEIEERIDRDMPPASYIMIHPDAKLSEADKQALIEGVRNTFAGGSGDSNQTGEDDDD